MNNQSKRCLESKATTTTQHNSPKTVIFQRKIGCLGWDSNPRPSACWAMLLPTELPRQLSWLGRILHTNLKASQPDKQVKSNLVFRRCICTYSLLLCGCYVYSIYQARGLYLNKERVVSAHSTGHEP